MYFNSYGKKISQIDCQIDKLSAHLDKDSSSDLKNKYIELLKRRECLRCEAELESDVYYGLILPKTDLGSIKSVEDSILQLAGTEECEDDDFTKAYYPTLRRLEKRYGRFIDDYLIKVINILFEQRKRLINIEHHPFVFSLDLSLVERFNSLLKDRISDIYQKVSQTMRLLQPIFENNEFFWITSKLDISRELPSDFPIQSERMKKIWSYMCNPEFNSSLHLSAYERVDGMGSSIPTLNDFLYLEDIPNESKMDWNHLLSLECGCPYNLPEIESLKGIIYAMHNITDHLNYSIYEIIYATEFTYDITVETRANS